MHIHLRTEIADTQTDRKPARGIFNKFRISSPFSDKTYDYH